MVKNVQKNLDLSKASDPARIAVVVLKNCEPQLSYILAGLFNMCLSEYCFPDCWNVLSVVPLFKNVGERPTARPLDISKAFDRFWHTGLLHNNKPYGIPGQIFGLISSFGSNRQFCVFLEIFTRISIYCWSSSRLHSYSYTCATIY